MGLIFAAMQNEFIGVSALDVAKSASYCLILTIKLSFSATKFVGITGALDVEFALELECFRISW